MRIANRNDKSTSHYLKETDWMNVVDRGIVSSSYVGLHECNTGDNLFNNALIKKWGILAGYFPKVVHSWKDLK